MNAVELAVFCSLFAVVVGIGLWSSRWRAGDLNVLEEWGLAGRRLGTIVTWFLQGGSVYTVYAFIAVPAHVYGAGAIGFFSIAYALVIFPISYFVLPRLWETSRKEGHLTAADFVGARLDSKTLTTAVALTGSWRPCPTSRCRCTGSRSASRSSAYPSRRRLRSPSRSWPESPTSPGCAPRL